MPDNGPQEQDVHIELAPAVAPAPRYRERPTPQANAAALVGQAPLVEPCVYLHVRAVEAMFRDVSAYGPAETGGILSGDQYTDATGPYVLVAGAVPARDALRTQTRVTFTQRGWSTMLAEREARFPGQSVIGWYHSHPDMPVALSEADLFVHRAFFSRPQDLAVVIDLHRLQWAVYGWRSGQVRLLPGFWVFADGPDDGADLAPILARFAPLTGT